MSLTIIVLLIEVPNRSFSCFQQFLRLFYITLTHCLFLYLGCGPGVEPGYRGPQPRALPLSYPHITIRNLDLGSYDDLCLSLDLHTFLLVSSKLVSLFYSLNAVTISVFVTNSEVTTLSIWTHNAFSTKAWIVSFSYLSASYVCSNTFLADSTR